MKRRDGVFLPNCASRAVLNYRPTLPRSTVFVLPLKYTDINEYTYRNIHTNIKIGKSVTLNYTEYVLKKVLLKFLVVYV